MRGLSAEAKVMSLTQSYFGGECVKSSKREDMFKHIDFFWIKDDHKISFDVKACKKGNRKDSDVDDQINWIEIQNIRGNPGWIYGKEDYVAFCTLNSVIYVPRYRIPSFVNNKIKDVKIVSKCPEEFYVPYRRHGVSDIIVKIPTSDLRKIMAFELPFKVEKSYPVEMLIDPIKSREL